MDLTDMIDVDFAEDDYFWSVLESSFAINGRYYSVPFAWVGSLKKLKPA